MGYDLGIAPLDPGGEDIGRGVGAAIVDDDIGSSVAEMADLRAGDLERAEQGRQVFCLIKGR